MKKIVLVFGLVMHSIFSWAVGIDIPLQVTGNEKPEWVHGQNKTSTRPSISIKYEGNVFYVESKSMEESMLEISFWDKNSQKIFDTSMYLYNELEFLVPENLLEECTYILVTFNGMQYVGMF